MHFRFTLIVSFLIAISFSKAQKNYKPSDIATISPVPYNYKAHANYKKVNYSSFYLTMRDGNKIAVDLFLPKGMKNGTKIPAIITQTCYWRSFEIRPPFNLFIKKRMSAQLQSYIKQFVESGYAVISADVRGTGASFGTRQHPWASDEIKDGAEIVDWILKQDWSNSIIGAAGASYTGTSAEFMLTNPNPHIKAVVSLFSVFDIYEDIIFPGGIHNKWFTSTWGSSGLALDNNSVPTKNKKIKMVIRGVRPVQGKGGRKLLKEAIASHSKNANVNDDAMLQTFRDDVPASKSETSINVFSPHHYVNKIDSSGAAIYSYSGWADGGYANAAIKKFLNLNNPHNKLLIGPWTHLGATNIDNFNPGKTGFDHLSEIMKFFDYHLRGIQTGIDKEPRVHYFTQGEEQWKSSDTWPPKSNYISLFFDKNNLLTTKNSLTMIEKSTTLEYASKNKNQIGDVKEYTSYVVDTTVGTGENTRWRGLAATLQSPYLYPNRAKLDSALLVFNSQSLTKDMEISGHPIITLYISSTAPDGCFFVYLEDIDENGVVKVVTEGQLRALNRKINNVPLYKKAIDTPQHSFFAKDALPILPGEVVELKFDLLPTSYVFKQGHKMRVAIAGADADYFRMMDKTLPTINVYHSDKYPSKLNLPMVDK